MIWHVLDARSIWIKEFASALAKIAPTLAWVPDMSLKGRFQTALREELLVDPPVRLCHFPLQRGYSQAPVSWFTQLGRIQVSRMIRAAGEAANSPLICTTPYYAPVARRWPGPVVYYLTDLTKAYVGAKARLVTRLDRKMCAVAALVCPNSQRIADYLQREAGCPASKIVIVPQATRAINVFPAPPLAPAPLPDEIAHLPRPVAGVSGNLAANQDWILMRDVVDRNAEYSWIFVGPVDMDIPDPAQREARQNLMSRGGRVVFTGAKPYGELRRYARCFDVALLPYQPQKEPTYSGSSTRFYEHLAACRPMLATRGFEELLHKEPLVKLVDTAEQITAALTELRQHKFCDGHENLRWDTSRRETWENRALTVKTALEATLAKPRA